jgi:membrane protease YdiL (CAAX protease family)
MRMQYKLIVAAALELTYAVVTRTWLRHHLEGAHLELAVSAFRVATIIVYWVLFRELIRARAKTPSSLQHPLLSAGIAVALAIPFLFQGWSPGGGFGTAVVFALTGIVVGIREELLYRAVLLNLLQPRLGVVGALFCTTAIFIVYHYGALPINWTTFTEVSCMALLLGLIYLRSGSLFAVATIHSLYDGIWFFGPFLSSPLPDVWRPTFLFSALALVVAWWRFSNRSMGYR